MATRQQLYNTPGVEQHKVIFEIADPEEIIATRTQETSGEVPVVHSDYLQPPSIHIFEKKVEEVPSTDDVENQVIVILNEKKASVAQAEEGSERAYAEWKEAQAGFFEEIKDELMAKDITGADICKMASAIDGQDTLRLMTDKVISFLYGIDKQAAMDFTDLINKDLNVTYVEGNHPLTIRYKGCVLGGRKVRDMIRWRDHESNDLDGIKRTIENGKPCTGKKQPGAEEVPGQKMAGVGNLIGPAMYVVPEMWSMPSEIKGHAPRWFGYKPSPQQQAQQVQKVFQTGDNLWDGPSDIAKLNAFKKMNEKPRDYLTEWRDRITLADAVRAKGED